MKLSWSIDTEHATLVLEPETAMDRAIIDGMGNVQTATVKRNGTLTFVLDLPKQVIAKPTIPRPADEVRDQ